MKVFISKVVLVYTATTILLSDALFTISKKDTVNYFDIGDQPNKSLLNVQAEDSGASEWQKLAVLRASVMSMAEKQGYQYKTSMDASVFEAVRAHAGLYLDKAAHPEFAKTVLVTAGNIAYIDMIRNWQCHADSLGLDYVVIAMDQETYDLLGSSKAVLVHGKQVKSEEGFRTPDFNLMTCNKIKMVQEILLETGLDVVFSDCDNVFKKDPFSVGVDLGDKMRQNAYHYIYQQNHPHCPQKEDIHGYMDEGNTGFYFVSGRRSMVAVQHLLLGALQECALNTGMDDQFNFWHAMASIRAGKGAQYGPNGFECANLCGQGATLRDGRSSESRACIADSQNVLNYCEMNPFVHMTRFWCDDDIPKTMASYHANFVNGLDAKKRMVHDVGLWWLEPEGKHCLPRP